MPTLPDYRLRFDQFPEVEVTMGRVSVEELFEFNDILAMPRATAQELRAYLDALAAFVGKHMVSWNLEDRRGRAVSVGRVTDTELLFAIRDGWLQGINGGRTPLDEEPALRPQEEADLADLMEQPSDAEPAPAS